MRKAGKIIVTKIFCTVTLLLLLSACNNSKKQNRLSKASSPYLQQHADNPVDWYEWGEEAIAKAKKENKLCIKQIKLNFCTKNNYLYSKSMIFKFFLTLTKFIANTSFI